MIITSISLPVWFRVMPPKGELKMQELRDRAEEALGADFDVRRFHDALLENGAVPLSFLEAHIDGWIEAEKAR